MIPVALAPEPNSFDYTIRQRGHLSLLILSGQKEKPFGRRDIPRKALPRVSKISEIKCEQLKTYWTDALPDMMKVYKQICAYSCVRINEVTGAKTVDHFLPKTQDRHKAYEWDNFHLACSQLNTNKGTKSVIDPFGQIAGWFELELLGFQVVPGGGLSPDEVAVVEDTIEKLKLNDPILLELRAKHAEGYWTGDYTFEHLMRESPFVALELKRQGRD